MGVVIGRIGSMFFSAVFWRVFVLARTRLIFLARVGVHQVLRRVGVVSRCCGCLHPVLLVFRSGSICRK